MVLSTQKPLPDWMQDPAGLWLQPHLPLGFYSFWSSKVHLLFLNLALCFIFWFYWCIVDLHCVNFCCVAKWFSCIYTLLHILFHYSLGYYCSLCYILDDFVVVYIFSLKRNSGDPGVLKAVPSLTTAEHYHCCKVNLSSRKLDHMKQDQRC